MRYHHRCGPGAHLEFDIPDALFAMGRGPRGKWGPFEWDFGDRPGGRHGGPGRGRRRMFEGGELRLVLLKLIVDEPRHGYDLIRAVEDMTGGQYAPSPGVVYPTFDLAPGYGPHRRSAGGRTAQVLPGHARGPRPPRRARRRDRSAVRTPWRADAVGSSERAARPCGARCATLVSALRHGLATATVTDETVHELAALIDEFAQRVERSK